MSQTGLIMKNKFSLHKCRTNAFRDVDCTSRRCCGIREAKIYYRGLERKEVLVRFHIASAVLIPAAGILRR